MLLKKQTSWLPIIAAGLLFFLYGCGDIVDDTTTLRLGHGLDVSHPVHKGMEKFADNVSELSNGDLEIEIYPSEQLGTEREMIELVQIGILDMSKVSAAVLGNFTPEYKVLSVPYLFRDRQHRFKAMDSAVGDSLRLAPVKYGFRAMGFYDAGFRSFYTNGKPIREPSDLEGMKIRVMESNTAIKTVEALGGSPTPIAWGELYSALQQSIVDGAENNPPSYLLSNHYEVTQYLSLDQHSAIPDVVIISEKTRDKLSSEEKKILRKAFDESVEYQKDLWQQMTKDALEKVKEEGIKVIRPDKEPFREKVQPVYESFKDRPELYSLIQEIQEIGSESNQPDTTQNDRNQ